MRSSVSRMPSYQTGIDNGYSSNQCELHKGITSDLPDPNHAYQKEIDQFQTYHVGSPVLRAKLENLTRSTQENCSIKTV